MADRKPDRDDIDRIPDIAIFLYGKAEACVGRKMGHINRIKPKS